MASLLDAVQADPDSNRNSGQLCKWYGRLADDIRGDLDRLLEAGERPTYLSQKLAGLKIEFPPDALAKHRRGACGCKHGRTE